MSKLFNWAAARLAAAFALALPLAADASPLLLAVVNALEKENPVTGETETYANMFTGGSDGTATEWNDADNWDTSKTPFISGADAYSSALVDGMAVSTTTSIDGWNLQVGAYNGASINWNPLGKIQGDTNMWLTVDATSSIAINGWGGGNLGQNGKNLNYYVAAQNGVTWGEDLASGTDQGLTMNYYLKGDGSVSYKGRLERASHVIKAADVTLSGTTRVASKTLVSFASSTKTFTAAADVKIYATDGTTLKKTLAVTSVRASGAAIEDTVSALTTSDAVGACEIVQCTDGVVLYYVDGDPAAIVPKTYLPSISVNFTSGTALSTHADVGVGDYAIPGTSWNNLIGNNGTLSTVTQVDSTGAASAMSGVSVTISGTRGSYSCGNLTPSSNPLHGYIDENGNNPTPTVTVTGIPYYKYRVLVYHSTDSGSVPFGYDTINGKNYTYVNDALSEGTTAWGDSGAQDSANAIAEGGNVLVTEALSGSTLTVVGHRAGGANNARGCIAAIQIIEVKADVGENDLEIPVTGDTQYIVEDTKELSGTVYLTGLGTLTLAGENKISAATIEISEGVTLVVNADRLDATTFTGAGTVVYDGSQPETTKGFDNSAWTGTVWVKNVGDTSKGEATDAKVTTRLGSDTTDATSNELNKWGNANSFVKFTNVRAFMAKADVPWTLVLEDDDTNYAWYNNEGWTARSITIAALKGDGTFWDINDGGCRPYLNFGDASQFTGTIKALGKQVFLNDTTNTGDASSGLAGRITVPANQTLTVASGKTWHTRNGLVVNGTLIVNGTLASDSTTAAVSGSGTVVFTGRAPTPTGDTWWKNAAWTGTVQMKSVTDLVGASSYTGTNFLPLDYGNTGSVLELYNCSGWLPNNNNYQCTVPLKVTGTLTINNGISGNKFVVSHLSGSGAICTTSNSATTTLQILEADGFTGYVQLNSKRVVFGNTLPSEYTVGNIYVGEGFSFTVPNSNVAWFGTGGITLAGELKAAALSNFGGGTTITTTDDGVFTLVSNSDTDDLNVDYTRIQGTGTLKFEGSKYRTISTNNFPTAMIVENNISNGLIHRLPGEEVAIGSLSGTGQMRSDWGGSGSTGDRDLRILQAKDTTYSGLFASSNDRIDEVYVAPGASTAGTLTLSGTQTASNGLIVETGASVNLTGTWVGATTVSGTFGGTGTLTGNLTFSDGATLKAAATALTVSGTVALPTGEGEPLTIDATGLDVDEATILSSSSITTETDVSKVTVNGLYTVEPAAGALKLVSTKVAVTVPVVAHATATVTVGGTPVEPTTEGGNVYKVAPDSTVTVVYAADAGYTFGDGKVEYTIDTATATTFVLDESTKAAQYIAKIVDGASYTSLQSAFDALENNNKVVLLATTDEGATIPSKSFVFYFYAGSFECGEIADAEGSFVTTSSDETIKIDSVEVTAKKYRVAAAVALVTLSGAAEGTYYGDYMSAYNDFLAGAAGTTMQVFGENPFSTDIPCTTYDTTTQTYTKLEAVASRIVSQMPINYPSLAAAVAAAEDGDTITLLANDRVSFANIEVNDGVPSGGSIVIDKNITINGAGFTVYGNTNAEILNATGSATPGYDMVADLVDGSNLLGFFVKSGNVTFQNVTLTEFGDTAYVNKFGYTPIQTASDYTGTLTLTDVNFSKFNRTAVCVRGGTLAMTGGTVTANATHKNPDDHCQQPLEVRGGSATISGVTVVSDFAYANNYGAIVAWGDTTVNNVNIDFTGIGVWADVANVAITGDDTEISATTQSVFVEEGGSATIAAGDFAGSLAVDSDANSSITVSGGTFDAVVPDEYLAEGYEVLDNGDGTYGVREDKGWVYSTPGYWNYTGTWSDGATLGEEKVTIEDGATYTASEASDGRFVTVAMTLSFDDVNDDDSDFGDAKAAIRLAAGETDGTYQFQLYTSDGENKVWTNATVVGVTATKEEDYNFVFVLDLTNKTYTASIVSGATTNVLSIGESITAIPFACQGEVTPVQTIDFVGAGKVSSIEGSYETPEEPPAPEGFDEDDTIGEVKLTAEQATWLNEQNNYDELATKIATMTADAFNNAYLLNLDITGEFSYEFTVTNIEVGDDDVTLTVSLTRTGTLDETTKINGTVALTGTDELGKEFETISEATVADEDFSEGSTTTITLDKGDAKFFQPVIK